MAETTHKLDPVEDIPLEVLDICTAYEQGYGKGQGERKVGNPYSEASAEWFAWGWGYHEGDS